MKSSADLFASQGNPWNHPNYQLHATQGFRRKTEPDGTTSWVRVGIEGYDRVTTKPKIAREKRILPSERRHTPEEQSRLDAIDMQRVSLALKRLSRGGFRREL